MRIIDKNTDYYDYYQNILKDDTFTFDRRDSYNLTKEEFCRHFYAVDYKVLHPAKTVIKVHLLMLQICNTFWLIKLTPTKIEGNIDTMLDYDLQVLCKIENYDRPRVLLELSAINIKDQYFRYDTPDSKLIESFTLALQTNTLEKHKPFKDNDTKETRTIPILKNIGLPAIIDPKEIYLALEQYFSLEKTASERTESVGLTNNEKIENHGFDTKISFRGK